MAEPPGERKDELSMKVTQYNTAQGRTLQAVDLHPMGDPLGGAWTVEISEQPEVGDFLGFGVAVTGSSCYHLNLLPQEVRDQFLENIYGKDGLGLSVARLTVGSSDYSEQIYTYDDCPQGGSDPELKQFSVARDEDYILPMIREVQKHAPDLFFFASPWTPPAWMTTGGAIGGGYMRHKYIDAYADYMVKFIQAYGAHGIDISALTPQNETETNQGGMMPACIWHPEIEAEFVICLKEKLKAAGLSTKIWIYDHNFSGWNRVKWCFEEYPALQEACDGVAFHYYAGAVEMLNYLRPACPNTPFHFTEGGPRLNDHYADDWCKWGIMMSKALRNGCRSFTGWNLMLDETGGPNIGPFFCGGLATRNSQTGELTYSGQYKALNHFSRFTKPGAKVYKTAVPGDLVSMMSYPAAAEPVGHCFTVNPDGSAALHLVNGNGAKRQFQVNYGGQWWYIEVLPKTLTTVVFEK